MDVNHTNCRVKTVVTIVTVESDITSVVYPSGLRRRSAFLYKEPPRECALYQCLDRMSGNLVAVIVVSHVYEFVCVQARICLRAYVSAIMPRRQRRCVE